MQSTDCAGSAVAPVDRANIRGCMGKRSQPADRREQNDGRTDSIETVTQKLKNAGIDIQRFVDVAEGRKQSYNHDQRAPDEINGNYGISTGRGFVAIDIDSTRHWENTPGTERLSETFTVSTPHGGEHRYFSTTDGVPWIINAMTDGAFNPSFRWGELYTTKYLVGPGSEIRRCNKPDCYACTDRNPQTYEIASDRPIARLTADEVVGLLRSSTDSSGPRQSSIAEYNINVSPAQTSQPATGTSETSNGAISLQLCLGENRPANSNKRVMWKIITTQSSRSTKPGASLKDVIEQAGENGIGCRRAFDIVSSWLRSDTLQKPSQQNRIVPNPDRWER